MDNNSYHLPVGDVLKHCNNQYHKVKNMTEQVQSISDNLHSHSEQVALLANGASKLINLELEQLKLSDKSSVPINSSANEQDLTSMIHKKLDDLMAQSETACNNVKKIIRKAKCTKFSEAERSRDQLPSLPTTSSNHGDEMSSCTESDFVPDRYSDGDTSFGDSTTSSFCQEMHDKHPDLFPKQHHRHRLTDNLLAAVEDTRVKMTEEELNFMNESERNSFIDGCEKSRYFLENQVQSPQGSLDFPLFDRMPVFVVDKQPRDLPSTSYSPETSRPQASNRLTKFRATKQLRPREHFRGRVLSLHGRTASRCRSSYHLSSVGANMEAKAAFNTLKKSKSFDSAPCPIKRLKSSQSEIVFS